MAKTAAVSFSCHVPPTSTDWSAPFRLADPPVTAVTILQDAAAAIAQRAASRDTAAERSMARTVAAFNALTGHTLTEVDGWLFMAMLKAARSRGGAYHGDDYTDGAAYFSLAGEAAFNAAEFAEA